MHNICYMTFKKETTLRQMTDEVLTAVSENGDRYGTQSVTQLSGICKDRDAAEQRIAEHDTGWYGGFAVQYYDFSKVKESAAAAKLRQRVQEQNAKKVAYMQSHSVKLQKADYIGCKGCGSKLRREKLRGELCPLCGKDLRAPSTLERIKAMEDKQNELERQYIAAKHKDTSKAEVRWLVKYEYHS